MSASTVLYPIEAANAMPPSMRLWARPLFDHNLQRAHQALRLPVGEGMYRYHLQSPAMALGLADHLWSFQELLTTRVPITP